MPHVVFVCPFFLPTTLRFVDSITRLPGVRVGLVSQDPVEKLDAQVRNRLAYHFRIDDGLDPAQITRATRWMQQQLGSVDLLLGTLEQLQVPLAEVRTALGLPGMGVEQATNFREKSRMKDVLRTAGIPCARHQLITGLADALKFAAQVGYPLVVKPPAGAGAISTFQVEDEKRLRTLIEQWNPGPGREVLAEEFISGLERSFEVVSVRGQRLWHSLTRYAPSPLEVLRNPWIQWTVLLPREVDDAGYDDVRKVGYAALDALGMETGLSHMEWFRRRDNSVAVSEIGARPPGAQIMTLMSLAHDVDMYDAWAKLVVYEQWTPPKRRFAAGAAFLRGQGRGEKVVRIHGLDEAQRRMGQHVVEAKLPRTGQSRSTSYEGEGYVLVKHERTEVVEQALRELITHVYVELG